jgi:hypothetical protein
MAPFFDLAQSYWTRPQRTDWRAPVTTPPAVFETLAETIAAGHEARLRAEWNMPHMLAMHSGEITRLEMYLRRPAVFLVADIWETMEQGYTGGEFPGPLVDAYIDRNGDIWPLLEEVGFTKGADNDRAWDTYEGRQVSVR